MLKASDIRELSLVEAQKQLTDTRQELLTLRLGKQAHAGQIENPSALRTLRRDIARLRTLIKEKQRAEALEAIAAAPETPNT